MPTMRRSGSAPATPAGAAVVRRAVFCWRGGGRALRRARCRAPSAPVVVVLAWACTVGAAPPGCRSSAVHSAPHRPRQRNTRRMTVLVHMEPLHVDTKTALDSRNRGRKVTFHVVIFTGAVSEPESKTTVCTFLRSLQRPVRFHSVTCSETRYVVGLHARRGPWYEPRAWPPTTSLRLFRIRLKQGGETTDLHRLQPCAARRGARGVQRGEAVERQVQHAQQRAARLREG